MLAGSCIAIAKWTVFIVFGGSSRGVSDDIYENVPEWGVGGHALTKQLLGIRNRMLW